MTGIVIHAFGRKPDDPAPAEAEIPKAQVCAVSLELIAAMKSMVEAGALRMVCFVGIADDTPISGMGIPAGDINIVDMALLRVGVDGLEHQVKDVIRAGSYETEQETE